MNQVVAKRVTLLLLKPYRVRSQLS
ncbi:hypothetical protein SAMN05192585_11167 [Acetanaerobacterium elongatum]|uniref:Uncharacterized protein n=1 Tax=Acetanaerobacterium elongatum TaxID=258515 RepID=A0A1G9YPM5_9FIRM|nr:hypothetical protein SAMN05192585_11167 [Acetanaerobacterium elongatum]